MLSKYQLKNFKAKWFVLFIILGPPSVPTDVHIESVTAISANLSWKAGLDGGYPQSFRVSLHPSGSSSFSVEQSDEAITDPGHGQVVQHRVVGLQPLMDYQFKVVAKTRYGSQESVVVNATTLGEL